MPKIVKWKGKCAVCKGPSDAITRMRDGERQVLRYMHEVWGETCHTCYDRLLKSMKARGLDAKEALRRDRAKAAGPTYVAMGSALKAMTDSGITVVAAAQRMGISLATAYGYRHRLKKALAANPGMSLGGSRKNRRKNS